MGFPGVMGPCLPKMYFETWGGSSKSLPIMVRDFRYPNSSKSLPSKHQLVWYTLPETNIALENRPPQ